MSAPFRPDDRPELPVDPHLSEERRILPQWLEDRSPELVIEVARLRRLTANLRGFSKRTDIIALITGHRPDHGPSGERSRR
jgi:hypothetical protein